MQLYWQRYDFVPPFSILFLVFYLGDPLRTFDIFLLLQGFKFALAAGKQISTLKEANLSLQADLDKTLADLAHTQQSVEPLRRAAAKSEDVYHAAMVEVRRLERCLDTETARSLRRRESKHKMRAENNLLLEENRLLRRTVADLEADKGPSFADGYFTASYGVVQGLPADFDLRTAFGWDREQILARASELAGHGPGDPAQNLDPSPEVILVDEEDAQAGSSLKGEGAGGTDVQNPVDKREPRRDDV